MSISFVEIKEEEREKKKINDGFCFKMPRGFLIEFISIVVRAQTTSGITKGKTKKKQTKI